MQPPANPPPTGVRHTPLIPRALHPPLAAGCTLILAVDLASAAAGCKETEQMTHSDRENAETEIAAAVERELLRLVARDGHPPDLVLAVALARVLTVIADRHGGDVAAEAVRRAAERCTGLPSRAACPLAAMPAAGRC